MSTRPRIFAPVLHSPVCSHWAEGFHGVWVSGLEFPHGRPRAAVLIGTSGQGAGWVGPVQPCEDPQPRTGLSQLAPVPPQGGWSTTVVQDFPRGAGLLPCTPLLPGVHCALDYLLKIYFEEFLFCFVFPT